MSFQIQVIIGWFVLTLFITLFIAILRILSYLVKWLWKENKMYKNGEITNESVIIALKNMKREIPNLLSNLEKDAIDKAIDNTIKLEKLNNFIDNQG